MKQSKAILAASDSDKRGRTTSTSDEEAPRPSPKEKSRLSKRKKQYIAEAENLDFYDDLPEASRKAWFHNCKSNYFLTTFPTSPIRF